MYWSAQAAITKCHRLGGLNNRNLFLPVLEAEKSKINVPTEKRKEKPMREVVVMDSLRPT